MHPNSETIRLALEFAADYHKEQKVPGTDRSYLIHLTAVALEASLAAAMEPGVDTAFLLQCAILHDVVEDTPATYGEVKQAFGADVADGVMALTKNEHLPKPEQMPDSLKRILLEPREVAMVKLCDRICNLEPPPHYWDDEKRRKYQTEAKQILATLGHASAYLSERLQMRIDAYPRYFIV
jgi:(p)ppGpp synthase/HD superfamily hydrolase